MSILIQIKAIFVALFLTVCVLLPTCLVALPLPLRRRLKLVSPAWEIFSKGLLRFGCDASLDFYEDHRAPHLRTVPAYGLYVANHQSYMDIPLVATMFQIPPIMKKEVLYIPFFGLVAWASGSLPVSRSSVGSRKKVFVAAKKRLVDERIALQVYPEGTRSKDGLPKSFDQLKRTLMVVAYNEKVPVIPTSLYGTRGVITPKGLIRANRHLGIIVHKEIYPENYASAEEFCRACWDKVKEGHDRMREKLAPLNGN